MKKKHLLFSLLFILSLIVSQSFTGSNNAISYTSGPPSGKSGSPGDGGTNCTQCHAGTPTAVTGWIASNIPVSGYTPGSTYTITLTATGTTQTKFGFQATAEKDADNTKAGTPIITNTTETQIMGTDWVEHNTAGTTGTTGSHTWSFDWIAPTSGTGDITFYAAFLVTNNLNNNSGDNVYTSSLSISEHIPVIANVFINEIHYDNAGSDSLEGVEIAGEAGIDLTCYSLVFYNGTNGTSYKTEALNGTLSNQACGFGTAWFPVSSVQNGSPDGVALYNTCTSTLVQFLSYEGAFTATNDVASGNLSVDIGLSESSSTAGGNSLQLTGSGTSYSDFSWTGTGQNTYNSVNTNQDFGTTSLTASNDAFLCEGDSITITASASGGMAPYTYFWDNGLSSDTSHTISPLSTTNYNVYAVDSANCPSNTAQFTIVVSSNPQLTTSNDTSICNGSSVLISAQVSNGTSPYTFNWNNGLTSNNTHTVSPSSNTTYTISIIDDAGCQSSSDSIIVSVNPSPLVNTDSIVTASSTCGNNDGNITGTIVSNGTIPYTYSWADTSGAIVGNTQDLTNMSAGSYSLTITDANGCTATTGIITISDNIGSLSISAEGDTTVCLGDSVIISATATGGAAPYTYFWNNGLSSIAAHTVAPSASTIYIVYAIDNNGCQTNNDTSAVDVSSLPVANFISVSSNLMATFTNTSTGAATYSWDFGDGNSSNDESPIHSFTSAGTYTVCLTVTSNDGCSNNICKEITIAVTGLPFLDNLTTPFIYPNPSRNGEFNIEFGNYLFRGNASLVVYNMQGKKVYEESFQKVLASGKILLSNQPEGVYLYRVADNEFTTNGKLTIIK